MLLPLCVEDAETGRTGAHEDFVKVGLRPVNHVELVVATGVPDIAWQWQYSDDGGTPSQLQQVSVESRGSHSCGRSLRKF